MNFEDCRQPAATAAIFDGSFARAREHTSEAIFDNHAGLRAIGNLRRLPWRSSRAQAWRLWHRDDPRRPDASAANQGMPAA
jgi:hypothetical protein